MKKYKLKPEYEGIIVSKNHMALGKITFDPTKVAPENYHNYVKLGFEELFEEIIEAVVQLLIEKTIDLVEDVVDNVKEKRAVKNARKNS